MSSYEVIISTDCSIGSSNISDFWFLLGLPLLLICAPDVSSWYDSSENPERASNVAIPASSGLSFSLKTFFAVFCTPRQHLIGQIFPFYFPISHPDFEKRLVSLPKMNFGHFSWAFRLSTFSVLSCWVLYRFSIFRASDSWFLVCPLQPLVSLAFLASSTVGFGSFFLMATSCWVFAQDTTGPALFGLAFLLAKSKPPPESLSFSLTIASLFKGREQSWTVPGIFLFG